VLAALIGAACMVHEPLRTGALAILRAPFRLVVSVIHVGLTLPQLPGLARENARLRTALSRRSLELAQTRETLRRTTQAEALLATASQAPGVVASVIGRSPIPTQHTIWLDRGTRDGLQLDGLVVDAHGVVGRLIDVHPSTSLAMLITDPNSRVAGLVERSRESGLLSGEGHAVCRLSYLGADADMAEGDRIVTAGVGGVFPKGLLLGTVLTVARDDAAGSAEARVRPAARLGRLEEVLCLPPA